MRNIESIFKAKQDYESGKLTKTDVEEVRKSGRNFIRHMVEFMQRSRGRSLERAKIKVRYGEKFGEVTVLGNTGFIVMNIDAKDKELQKAAVNEDGSLGPLKKATLEEFEKALAKIDIPSRVFVREATFESLKSIFGRDVQILVHY